MTAFGGVREATAADADAILELSLLRDIAEIGEPDTTIDEVSSDIAGEDFFSAVIDDPRGGILSYVWVEYASTFQRVYGDIAVRPGADPALAAVMLDWLRVRAQQIAPGVPIYLFCHSGNTMKSALYDVVGGEIVRRFYRMEIRFDEPPPAVAALDAGVVIRPVTSAEADLRTMHAVITEAFQDHFANEDETYDHWAQHTLTGSSGDLSLWWLAYVDGQPAAGLYAAEVVGKGYVDTLGTRRDYRGRGLGRALLLTSFDEFYRRGLRKVALGVDATNPTGALALYESVGMTAVHEGWRYELQPRSYVT